MWAEPRDDLTDICIPTPFNNETDLLQMGCKPHGAMNYHCYTNLDCANCLVTWHSFTRICLRLSGDTTSQKTMFQPTIAMSSTEAEFMAAGDAGKIILYVSSILYDLCIPQPTASIIYEDNGGTTAIANASKPTTRTRHMNIR